MTHIVSLLGNQSQHCLAVSHKVFSMFGLQNNTIPAVFWQTLFFHPLSSFFAHLLALSHIEEYACMKQAVDLLDAMLLGRETQRV